MGQPLRIGIAGLGTVGIGVLKGLTEKADLLARRCGRPIEVVAVSARDRTRKRGIDLDAFRWHDDPTDLAADDQVDVVCELMGGADGAALATVEAALKAGKAVVTANKALLAMHGPRLADLADAGGAILAYEAAVAGGIPIIKGLRDGLAGNVISRVFGILNGTCNYILTEMRETGRDFAEVLSEAQALGYAEADPSFDVDGIDAAHKLAILAALAFNGRVAFGDVHIEGIRQISSLDIDYAEELGYRIKLLGIARRRPDGLELRVYPAMVDASTPIASVEGVFNAIVADGDQVDQIMMIGRGAGEGPTASAVIADILDIARGFRAPTLGLPARDLPALEVLPPDAHRGAFYVRLMVVDQPGVIADIAALMRDHDVSIEGFLQRARSPDEAVPVVMTTHETDEAELLAALEEIGRLGTVVEPPHMIRIETL